jgi:hypothetical protein
MVSRRAQFVALIFCIAVQAGIIYGLEALGAIDQLILTTELVWLCASVVIISLAGDQFARKKGGRGD